MEMVIRKLLQGDFGYTDANVWYITSSKIKKIESCTDGDLYSESVKIYKIKKENAHI